MYCGKMPGDKESDASLCCDRETIADSGESVAIPLDESDSETQVFRKSERNKKLALKARENKIITLTQSLANAVDEQLEKNEKFFDQNEFSDDGIEELLEELEQRINFVASTYSELRELSEGNVNTSTVNLYDQFSKDAQSVKEYCCQLKEAENKEEELQNAELELEEAKQRLDREMKELELRMAERRARLQEKLKVRPTSNIGTVLRPSSPTVEPQSTGNRAAQPLNKVNNTSLLQRSNISSDQHCLTTSSAAHSSNLASQLQPESKAAHWHNRDYAPSQGYNLAQDITEHMHISLLAPPEPSVFSGDPLEYADWRVSFDSLIDSKRGSAIEKLHRLRKYVDGDAKEAISGYFRQQTSSAYQDALDTLQEEFGNNNLVEDSFRDKLESYPKIPPKDQAALKKYSYFLKQCLSAQRAIPSLRVLDDRRENKKFVKTLPDWLTNRWARYITDKETSRGFPTFTEYVNFIAYEARVSTNNLKEPADPKVRGNQPTSKSQRATKSYKADTKETDQPASGAQACACCGKNNHTLQACFILARKPYEERDKLIRDKRLCFRCLNTGHRAKDCKNPATCRKCDKKHPTSLHREPGEFYKGNSKTSSEDSETTNKDASEPPKKVAVQLTKREDKVLSMAIPVYVSAPGSEERIPVYALLDTQSDACFISKDVVRGINIPSKRENITIATLNGEKTKKVMKYSALQIHSWDQKETATISAYEHEGSFSSDREQMPTKEVAMKYPHLKEVAKHIQPSQDIPIGLLIGANCFEAMAPLESRIGKKGEPFAVKFKLGWTLSGGMSVDTNLANQSYLADVQVVKNLETKMMRCWDANDDDDIPVSQDDIKFMCIMNEQTKVESNGSYQMPLPFKKEPSLPNNYKQAAKRLELLKGKLDQDETLKKEYKSFMNEVFQRGEAEKVDIDLKDSNSGKVWYVPHFGVRHAKKGKLRVVFDCSARYRDTCLNDHLLQGPEHMNSIIGILMRFRNHEIALSCDVEKMFHNFHLPEEDRDFFRFLWWDDDSNVVECRMKVHIFGATSSPAVATYGLRRIAQDNANHSKNAVEFIVSNLYVDDGITSVPTKEEAIKLIEESRKICSSGNLRLHKFVSNDADVLRSLPASECKALPETTNSLLAETEIHRTLGMDWEIGADKIKFSHSLNEAANTRRLVLSSIAQLFDPLGLLSPCTLQGKNILQETNRQGLSWDHKLPPQLQEQWDEWQTQLGELNSMEFNRCIKPKDFGKVIKTEVHYFSDASQSGLGACAYVRFTNEAGLIHCTLLTAKSRVIPLKGTSTIPRLELQAAVMAARLSRLIQKESGLIINKEHFWTDSMIVLGYIRNDSKRFHVFVANRVREIRDSTEVSNWHHVPTEDNPADVASRGCTVLELSSKKWFSGPNFLWKGTSCWPISDSVDGNLDLSDPEVKRVKTNATNTCNSQSWMESIAKRCSSWNKLTKVIAICMKIARKKTLKCAPMLDLPLPEAERMICKLAQEDFFASELRTLKAKQELPKTSNVLKLNPFLDNAGLLRVGGRLSQSLALSYEEKHPVLMEKSAAVSRLLVQHHHQKVHHQGQTTTLGAFRESGYWVTGASKVVRGVIHRCVICKRLRGRPVDQLMSDLPAERTQASPPFTHVGIDCFGPFIVKERRTELKRWGLVVTCLYSRAVHIEVLDSLSTDSFLNALQSVVCIRGPIRTVFCDQGTNFVGAHNELTKELQKMNTKLRQQLLKDRMEFKFNAPSASHAGGVWERQIRTIRAVLAGLMMTYEGRMDTATLRTAFYEAMSTVNSRPLTVDKLNDPEEIVITPNHLLTMKSRQPQPLPGEFEKQDCYGRLMWRKVQSFANMFWDEWRTTYLAEITKRQRWEHPRRNLQVGDLVMLSGENQPRNTWPTAIVEEVLEGTDGYVRRAKVRVANRYLDKEGRVMEKAARLERPVQKLILLLPVGNN